MERRIARVDIVKNRYKEWVVRAWDQNGQRYKEADYFANDYQDAMGTARLMVNPGMTSVQLSQNGK